MAKSSLCGAYGSIAQWQISSSSSRRSKLVVTSMAKQKDEDASSKESLFTSITSALDFSQTRSEKDADLIEQARKSTKSGEKMTPEQYGALRRKIGGTYKDFFKDSVDVKGAYVEAGWVDKRCKICRKDTSGSPRSKDELGQYAHVECLEARAKSGNLFSRLFGK